MLRNLAALIVLAVARAAPLLVALPLVSCPGLPSVPAGAGLRTPPSPARATVAPTARPDRPAVLVPAIAGREGDSHVIRRS